MFVLSVGIGIKVNKIVLPELSRGLITIVLDLGFCLIHFRLEALSNYFFLLDIFIVIPKKSSNFSSISYFNICFKVISFCLALDIVYVFSKFWDIEDKRVSKYIQYLGKNLIELFIISIKILYFFIHRWQRIIGYWLNLEISNRTRLWVCFLINNIG